MPGASAAVGVGHSMAQRNGGWVGIFLAVLCKEGYPGGARADHLASARTARHTARGGPHGPPFSFARQRHSSQTRMALSYAERYIRSNATIRSFTRRETE